MQQSRIFDLIYNYTKQICPDRMVVPDGILIAVLDHALSTRSYTTTSDDLGSRLVLCGWVADKLISEPQWNGYYYYQGGALDKLRETIITMVGSHKLAAFILGKPTDTTITTRAGNTLEFVDITFNVDTVLVETPSVVDVGVDDYVRVVPPTTTHQCHMLFTVQ